MKIFFFPFKKNNIQLINRNLFMIWQHSFFSAPDRLSVCLYTFHIFIFFSRTTGPISTKLGTKYPWLKGIHKGHALPKGEIIGK